MRHTIHAVGPVWGGVGHGEADVLASCCRRSLQIADELDARTVAFPAIAAAGYGFPPDQAVRIPVSTNRSAPTNVQRVRLAAIDDDTRKHLPAATTATD